MSADPENAVMFLDTAHFCNSKLNVDLNSSFVSKIFDRLFLKTESCYIVSRDIGEQKWWTEIAYFNRNLSA